MSKFICGRNSVHDALKDRNIKIKKILITKNQKLNFIPSNLNIEIVDKHFLDQLTNHLNHQGIVALIDQQFQYYSVDQIIQDQPPIILILDHIEDVHNIGAILRTANAAGIKSIIIPDKRSATINETTLRISSGGFVGLKIAKVNSLQPVIEKLKKNNYWIYASALTEDAQDYTKVRYNFPLALVIGNEAKGVSKTIINHSDQLIYIQMKGTVQSLNVSVATGILLFNLIQAVKKD